MSLNPPGAGLRRIIHDSRDASKVQISVPAGGELTVDDDIAAQLLKASPQFKDAGATATQSPDASVGVEASGATPAKRRKP